ncbi:putative transcriptional regulator YdeE [Paenibacillus harenae]|uniref:Transcriptional regulator YdeE n=1 Tax=Paenibacillus harenae TaxID=306543 RepID=A0ABT9TZC6_PAEHA|nr:putative transcriptional regulator YdeE [Paenibacillus harenae]
MKVELIETTEITSYVGIRAHSTMTNLGSAVHSAFQQLTKRRDEINNVVDRKVTYGITPPNYKGNDGMLDFYCCYEVKSLTGLPHGMVHIHLLPRLYSVTHYKGPASRSSSAYDFTSKWLSDHGYTYDDVSYYFERYDEMTVIENDDESNQIAIYCPIKKK